MSNPLATPLTLPCGVVLKNRIVKSCMSDSLGDGSGNPTPQQIRLYERWAEGGTALSCIGEVQMDPRFPEKPGNLVLSHKSQEKSFKELTQRSTSTNTGVGAHLWAQLGHAGALSHSPIHKPRGPSDLVISDEAGTKVVLECDGLTKAEIQALPQMYAKGAARAKDLGFTGVLVHAGHGFLLSQFICPLFNQRSDEYGSASVPNRCRIILEIVQAVRQAVGPSFPVGIRLNSSDQIEGGLTEDDSLEVVRLLDSTSIDIIDISGGTYFPGAKNASDASGSKGPYFLNFAKRAKLLTQKPLILTGGFKKWQQAIDVIQSGAADMVGVARSMVLDPHLAKKWTENNQGNDETVNPTFPRFESTVPGGVTAWYTMRLTALGQDNEDQFDMDLPTAVKVYEDRDAAKTTTWKATFASNLSN